MLTARILPQNFSPAAYEALKEKLFYASEALQAIEFTEGRCVRLFLSDEADTISAQQKLDRVIQRFIDAGNPAPSRTIHVEPGTAPQPNREITEELLERGLIVKLGEGQFAVTGVAVELLEYFDRDVREMGQSLGAHEYRYPTIIPIRAIQRINYLASRPECLNFVSHLREDVDLIDAFSKEASAGVTEICLGDRVETDCVNAVAVCLHTHHQLQDCDLGSKSVIVGAVGKCMRYETKNMNSLERLRDFTMREIICVGTRNKVLEFRQQTLQLIKNRLVNWGLNSFVETARDMFFTSEFADQSNFQQAFGLKYEVRARLSAPADSLAIASLNYHQDFMGRGFGIQAENGAAHSCCVGFGLERCVYAFLTQHGLERSNWPDAVAQRFGENSNGHCHGN